MPDDWTSVPNEPTTWEECETGTVIDPDPNARSIVTKDEGVVVEAVTNLLNFIGGGVGVTKSPTIPNQVDVDISAASAPVDSVFGRIGTVIAEVGDYAAFYAPLGHVGDTGAAHGAVTTLVNGFMVAADKVKLDGIEAGAEVNIPLATEEGGVGKVADTQTLNFTGAGVTVTDAGGNEATITIPGSTGGGTVAVEDSGVSVNPAAAILNFDTNLTVSQDGDPTQVNISATGGGSGGGEWPDGTLSAPGAHFVSEPSLGIWRQQSGLARFVFNDARAGGWTSQGVFGGDGGTGSPQLVNSYTTPGNAAFGFGGDLDTGMTRHAADSVGLVAGGNTVVEVQTDRTYLRDGVGDRIMSVYTSDPGASTSRLDVQGRQGAIFLTSVGQLNSTALIGAAGTGFVQFYTGSTSGLGSKHLEIGSGVDASGFVNSWKLFGAATGERARLQVSGDFGASLQVPASQDWLFGAGGTNQLQVTDTQLNANGYGFLAAPTEGMFRPVSSRLEFNIGGAIGAGITYVGGVGYIYPLSSAQNPSTTGLPMLASFLQAGSADHTFNNDTDTGMRRVAADRLALVAGGVDAYEVQLGAHLWRDGADAEMFRVQGIGGSSDNTFALDVTATGTTGGLRKTGGSDPFAFTSNSTTVPFQWEMGGTQAAGLSLQNAGTEGLFATTLNGNPASGNNAIMWARDGGPQFTWNAEQDAGMRRVSGGNYSLVAGGTQIIDWSTTAISFNAPATFAGGEVIKLVLGEYALKTANAGTVTGAVTVDMANGSVHELDLTGNVTSIDVINEPSATEYVPLTLHLRNNTGGAITVPNPLVLGGDWGDHTPVTSIPAGERAVVTAHTINNGADWFLATVGTGYAA